MNAHITQAPAGQNKKCPAKFYRAFKFILFVVGQLPPLKWVKSSKTNNGVFEGLYLGRNTNKGEFPFASQMCQVTYLTLRFHT